MDATTAILLPLLVFPVGVLFMHGRGSYGCGHSGHVHGAEADQPVPKRDQRRNVDFDPASR